MIKKVLFFMLLPLFSVLAQQVNIDAIKDNYDNFEYEKVITLTDSILATNDSIATPLFTELLIMKSVSLYVKNDLPGVRDCFFNILKRDNNYSIDSEKVSPKIVKIFSEVKKEYNTFIPFQSVKKEELKKSETTNEPIIKYIREKDFTGSLIKSIVFPGWSQLESGKTKGYILGSASLLNLGGIVYFIFDTNKKENDYLSEINDLKIISKYDEFNKSYKIRNTLLITYAGLSLISAIDMIFFNNEFLEDRIEITKGTTPISNYNLSFKIRF